MKGKNKRYNFFQENWFHQLSGIFVKEDSIFGTNKQYLKSYTAGEPNNVKDHPFCFVTLFLVKLNVQAHTIHIGLYILFHLAIQLKLVLQYLHIRITSWLVMMK